MIPHHSQNTFSQEYSAAMNHTLAGRARRSRSSTAFSSALECYQEVGVDVNRALRLLAGIPISLHCWQGDDVGGFENIGGALGGGLVATGNYPGKARTSAELRNDFE